MRRGRRNDLFDQPLVPIAAVVGVIAVIAIAAFFFMGSGSTGGDAASNPSSSASSGNSPATPAPLVSGTVDPSKIKEQPTVTIPANGTYVRVNYIGSFSGEYGIPGEMLTARNSGDRAFAIENANGTVTATFKKLDGSTKQHVLTVEIWKNGKLLKSDTTTEPYGEVSISSPV